MTLIKPGVTEEVTLNLVHNVEDVYAPPIYLNVSDWELSSADLTPTFDISALSDDIIKVYSGVTGGLMGTYAYLFEEEYVDDPTNPNPDFVGGGYPNLMDLSFDRAANRLWILKSTGKTQATTIKPSLAQYNGRTFVQDGSDIALTEESLSGAYLNIGAYNNTVWKAGFNNNDVVITRLRGTGTPSTHTFTGVAADAISPYLMGFEVDADHFFFLIDPTYAVVFKKDQNNTFTKIHDWDGLAVRTYEKNTARPSDRTDREEFRRYGCFSGEVLESGAFGPRIAYMTENLEVHFRYTYDIQSPSTPPLTGTHKFTAGLTLGPHLFPSLTTQEYKLYIKRREIDYEGPTFVYDGQKQLSGMSPASRQIIFEVQGEIHDDILMHEGSIIFTHDNVEYTVQSFTQQENEAYLLGCKYKAA